MIQRRVQYPRERVHRPRKAVADDVDSDGRGRDKVEDEQRHPEREQLPRRDGYLGGNDADGEFSDHVCDGQQAHTTQRNHHHLEADSTGLLVGGGVADQCPEWTLPTVTTMPTTEITIVQTPSTCVLMVLDIIRGMSEVVWSVRSRSAVTPLRFVIGTRR